MQPKVQNCSSKVNKYQGNTLHCHQTGKVFASTLVMAFYNSAEHSRREAGRKKLVKAARRKWFALNLCKFGLEATLPRWFRVIIEARFL